MKETLVTVLMSVYNGEKYLAEAMESIMGQTYRDFEFIIIDDGSTDTSAEIITSYSDPRIRLIKNETNIGLTRSLNKGIAQARGKYIARMDADDISLPERLEKQIEFMEENEEVAGCGTWAYIIDEEGHTKWEARMNFYWVLILFNIIQGNQFIHSSMLIKGDLIKENKYDEAIKYAQDYELWLRLIASGFLLVNIPIFLLNYREHKNNISLSLRHAQADQASIIAKSGMWSIFKIGADLLTISIIRNELILQSKNTLTAFRCQVVLYRLYKRVLKFTKPNKAIKLLLKSNYLRKAKHLWFGS